MSNVLWFPMLQSYTKLASNVTAYLWLKQMNVTLRVGTRRDPGMTWRQVARVCTHTVLPTARRRCLHGCACGGRRPRATDGAPVVLHYTSVVLGSVV